MYYLVVHSMVQTALRSWGGTRANAMAVRMGREGGPARTALLTPLWVACTTQKWLCSDAILALRLRRPQLFPHRSQ